MTMSLSKRKRIKNPKLLDRIRHNGYNRCQICGEIPSEVHHIDSKGAGGDDISENLVRLSKWVYHPMAHAGKLDKDYLRALALKRIEEEGE
ncbi:HNH endonuclease [Dehalobacter sp. DCM]|uniref:HNH endonuclease signature motif containing protein n=1 Tax=Dehalobacter sp. DCM TaxID=2907827 RepID=UPI003081E1CC|nr:HNH endonuclease [Dehalobacter sp. DCM]